MSDEPTLRPLRRVLSAIAAELAELASLADHLEPGVGDFAGLPSPAMIMRHQLADLLTQRLAGLTGFVGQLSRDAPLAALLDVSAALDGMKLAEQALRLSGEQRRPTCPPATQDDVLLFAD